jgi:hypothetical protein
MGLISMFKKQIDDIKEQTIEAKQNIHDIKAMTKGTYKQEQQEKKDFLNSVRNGNNMPITPPPSGTILKKNEFCHLAGESIYISEQSAGVAYGGARIRVAKNISLNGGNARKITQQVKINGYFIITNQRFMFIPYHNEKGFNINLNKIESYQFYKDGLLIRTANKNYMLNFNKKDTAAIEPVFIGSLVNIS